MNAVYNDKHNQGAFRIDENLNENNGLEINCIVIDDLNLEDICYIKIDVEGHEFQALLGLKKTILKYHPTIMIEIHESCPTKNLTFDFLKKFGYRTHYRLSHCDYIFPKY
jgi:hypothetical protein